MSSTPIVDRHEAKIKSITMEAPEGYEFGHIVKAEIEMRVASYVISTDKEGNVVRTAVLVLEGCHIKEALDPATAFTQAHGASHVTDDVADDADDADDDAPVSSAGTSVDPDTGEFDKPDEDDEDREPVGAGVGGSIDPEVGF